MNIIQSDTQTQSKHIRLVTFDLYNLSDKNSWLSGFTHVAPSKMASQVLISLMKLLLFIRYDPIQTTVAQYQQCLSAVLQVHPVLLVLVRLIFLFLYIRVWRNLWSPTDPRPEDVRSLCCTSPGTDPWNKDQNQVKELRNCTGSTVFIHAASVFTQEAGLSVKI